MSTPYQPVCIPVTWTAGSYWLAYHHGWTDARLYNVVEIYIDGRPQSALAGYIAAVDDFGDLVPIENRPYIERGSLDIH